MLIDFRGGRGRENVIGCLPSVPLQRDRTHDVLVHRAMSGQLNHPASATVLLNKDLWMSVV